jgi:hypothetical protein
MSKTLRSVLAVCILGAGVVHGVLGCLDNSSATPPDGGSPDSTSPPMEAGADGSSTTKDASSSSDGRSLSDGVAGEAGDAASGVTYTLIDDMETTTHGPIELAGINAPLTPGYWFNFGATAAADTAIPTVTMFTFTALPSPTTTLNGNVSMHAAHQLCSLNGQYDVCGLGFEIAQITDPDAGATGDAAADAAPKDAASDGGDAAPPIPKVTVPFDISAYKGIVFWGKATTTDAGDAGALDLKVQLPDTDTDPRGGVCNGAAAGASDLSDTSQCYNSYAVHEMVTGDWQRFTVMFGDLQIDPNFGYQNPAPWDGKKVYGINWQGQKNSVPDAGAETVDFWIDDVYFIQ